MTVTVEHIKNDLPNFPDRVIETWLLPIAREGYGWPPDPVTLGKWFYVLHKLGLDHWRQTVWTRDRHPLTIETMTPSSLDAINGIIQAYLMNIPNAYANLVDGRKRFNSLTGYVRKNGLLPVPPVLILKDEGVYFLDGNHSVAALESVRVLWKVPNLRAVMEAEGESPPETEHDVWIVSNV